MVETTQKARNARFPNIFEFQKKTALVITVRDYADLRTREATEEEKKIGAPLRYDCYGDLPSTDEDVMMVQAGLKRIGFKQEEIQVV